MRTISGCEKKSDCKEGCLVADGEEIRNIETAFHSSSSQVGSGFVSREAGNDQKTPKRTKNVGGGSEFDT